MKKVNVESLIMLLLVALVIAVYHAKTMPQIPGPVKATVTSFTVAHPALRPGERTSVRVSTDGEADGPLAFAWKAEAGTFSAEDTNPAVWTAPQSEGHYQVSVEVTDAAGAKAGGSAGVLVSKYPANPLIMSADPMGR
jgi:hypothetical protein